MASIFFTLFIPRRRTSIGSPLRFLQLPIAIVYNVLSSDGCAVLQVIQIESIGDLLCVPIFQSRRRSINI
jgi:hypothetical protein